MPLSKFLHAHLQPSRLAVFCLAICTSLALLLVFRLDAHSQEETQFIQWLNSVDTADLAQDNPDTLSYSPDSGLFYLFQGNRVVLFTTRFKRAGVFNLEPGSDGYSYVAFPSGGIQPVALDSTFSQLTYLPFESGRPTYTENIAILGLKEVSGMASDPLTGRIFILDAESRVVISIEPAADGRYHADMAAAENRILRISLSDLIAQQLGGLAYDSLRGTFFIVGLDDSRLYSYSESGTLTAIRDLSPLNLGLLGGLQFAPSRDSTDDPSVQSLYILDREHAQIAELTMVEPVEVNLPELSTPPYLVSSFDTSYPAWDPSSPDPIGMDYHPGLGHLILSDSEIEENSQPWYEGYNIFFSSVDGTQLGNCDTTDFSVEPVGVAINPTNGHIFHSDDNQREVFEIDFGPDGIYCNSDDILTHFDTLAFGSDDPEGVAYGNGLIFVVDGVNREVYVYSPGPNGIFDGMSSGGDDFLADSFDVGSMGMNDPEGIDYSDDNGTLIIVDRTSETLIQTTIDGTLLDSWDITFLNAVDPGAVSMAPGSITPTLTMAYISQRGIDNNQQANENDGYVYEVDLGISMSPPISVDDLTITISGTDSVLTWTAVTSNTNGVPLTVMSYHVYRDTDPDIDLTTPYTSVYQTIFTDTNAVSDTVQYYYAVIVEDTVGRISDASNFVGLFPFPLLPGSSLLGSEASAPGLD